MTIRDMVGILDAKVLRGASKLDQVVYSACCSDLMSDVLAFVNEKTVLLTGLTNQHVIRTAEMLDIRCIIYTRGKSPQDDILDSAEQVGLVAMSTRNTMFTSSGLLYSAGLRGAAISWEQNCPGGLDG
jgi:predicted transcriptional regulator